MEKHRRVTCTEMRRRQAKALRSQHRRARGRRRDPDIVLTVKQATVRDLITERLFDRTWSVNRG